MASSLAPARRQFLAQLRECNRRRVRWTRRVEFRDSRAVTADTGHVHCYSGDGLPETVAWNDASSVTVSVTT